MASIPLSAAARRALLGLSISSPTASKCVPWQLVAVASTSRPFSSSHIVTDHIPGNEHLCRDTHVEKGVSEFVADEHMERMLDAEIKSLRKFSVPKDFPFKMKRADSKYRVEGMYGPIFNLSRTFFGEKVIVQAFLMGMPEVREEEADDDSDAIYPEFIVYILKGKKKHLEIFCSPTRTGFAIDKVLLMSDGEETKEKDEDNKEDFKEQKAKSEKEKEHTMRMRVSNRPKYLGPSSGSLSKNLKEALLKYLELRGIDKSFAELVGKWLMSKKKEHFHWLKDMKEFIAK